MQSGLPAVEGYLKKMSRHGMWQTRYFVVRVFWLAAQSHFASVVVLRSILMRFASQLNNHFLNYFGKSTKIELLGSIDLLKVKLRFLGILATSCVARSLCCPVRPVWICPRVI